MATEVILPKVDMDMATGRIARWFVTEGATVKQGDTLPEGFRVAAMTHHQITLQHEATGQKVVIDLFPVQ